MLLIWTLWAIAIVSVLGTAAGYLKERQFEGPDTMTGAAVLFALIAWLQSRSLKRKKEGLRIATKAL
jgi:uncharacterized membrane protein (DUF4010 family)